MPITTPYGNPNWFKRQARLSTAREPKQPDMNDPAQAARMMYGAGIQLGESGQPRPTRDFGSLLRLNSSQMNSMSRGAKPGASSSLGQPMNSMYANNPGFFNRSNFAQQIQQRNQTLAQPASPAPSYLKRPAQTLDPDTPGGASAAARAKMLGPKAMLDSAPKGVPSLAPKQTFNMRPKMMAPATPAATSASSPLADRAAGLRLLREMSQTPLKVTEVGGGKNLVGQYGTGWSAPGVPPNDALVDKRPIAETMTGLANKQVREGTWRKGDRLPEGMTEEQAAAETEKARQAILSRQRTRK